MKRDYTVEVAAMTAEVDLMQSEIEALRVRYQLRSIDLRELREEAEDAEAWKSASKAQRSAVVALPAEVLPLLKADTWQQGGWVRAQLVESRLVRKIDGQHQFTALGKAARAYARRGAEWCGMAVQPSLFGAK